MKAKICGLGAARDVRAASAGGAAYVGFVFYPPSPRSVRAEQARALAGIAPSSVAKVGLFVDPDNDAIGAILDQVPLDYVQLHGNESPARVAEIRARTGLPVIKAVRLAEEADLDAVSLAEEAADQILCDAAPGSDKMDALPGGNGIAFDWRLVAGRTWKRPWLLAGGLTPENVSTAIELTGARQVDVSSGVENSPGNKNTDRIADFLRAAGAAPRTERSVKT